MGYTINIKEELEKQLEGKKCVDCGNRLKLVRIPRHFGMVHNMGVCVNCKRVHTMDGEPEFTAKTKEPVYYIKGKGFTTIERV